MARKILKALAVLVAGLLLVAVLGVLYLNFADLSRYRGTVERAASQAIGRKLTIGGDFQPDIGLTTRLVATDVRLANPPGWPEPNMAVVDRLEVEIDLLSVFFGPLTINRITADGVRVLLEKDPGGRATWQFDTRADTTDEDAGPIDIALGAVSLTGVELVYRDPGLPQAIELSGADLVVRSGQDGMLDVDLRGALNGAPLRLEGHLGPLDQLLAAGRLAHHLEGRLGDVTLVVDGTVADLASLGGIDATAELGGPDLAAIAERFGATAFPSVPFRIAGKVSPAPAGHSFVLDSKVGEMTATVDGTVDSLATFGNLDVHVDASGPSVREVGAMAGLQGLPADPFTISGRVHWQGFPVACDDFKATAGDNRISLEGVLGAPPAMLGSDFTVEAAGPNVASLAALAGLDLPAEDFEINGRLRRVDGGIRVENASARIGTTRLSADGTIGDPPAFAGTEFAFSARGDDLSKYGDLLAVQLPPLPFEVGGRLAPEGDAIALHGVEARLGAQHARVDGRIVVAAGLVGSDLHVTAEGPDLRWLEPMTGAAGLPMEPYRVEGGVRVVPKGYRLADVAARLGEMSLELDGTVGRRPGFEGTEVTLKAGGPDAARVAAIAGVANVPSEPFALAGTVRITGDGYVLDGVDASLGEARARADGVVGPLPHLDGTALTWTVSAPRLSSVQALVEGLSLPDAPFTATGDIGIDAEGYRLRRVVVEVADQRLEASGRVVPGHDLVGSELTVSLAGPDLASAGRLVGGTGLVELPELPTEPYTLAGTVIVDQSAYQLRGVDMTLGTAVAHLGGTIGRLPGLAGSDLTIDSNGPNASLFTALTGVDVTVAPFRVRGRVERLQSGLGFHDLRVQLGEYHLAADGTLGELPALVGTDIRMEAQGPSLKLIELLAGASGLPDQPFELEAHLDGNPQRFKCDRLAVRFGPSDLHGSFRLDMTGKPKLEAELVSDRIDVTRYLRERAERKKAETDQEQPPQATKKDRLIPDTPLGLRPLRTADADVLWTIHELVMPSDRYRDIDVDLVLHDGRLELGPVAVTGSAGGQLSANVILEPAEGDAYTLRAQLDLENGRLDLTRGDEDAATRPSMDAALSLRATGASMRQLAASIDGNIIVVLGEGQVDNSLADLVTADILVTLLGTLNPFSTHETTTTLECAVLATTFNAGVATLEPMAVQTAKMTMIGDGKIDLGTEKLSLQWVTKPRKGFGLSASMITNPYVSLGGTLAKPSIQMKPLEAMTTTGVAVATGGLSILARGLWDRVTSGHKVRKKAIEKAQRQAATRER